MALIILCASLFLAVALNTIVSKIANMFPSKSRKLATTIAYVLVVAVLTTICILVIPAIIEQTIKFMQDISALIESIADGWNSFSNSVDQHGFGDLLESVFAALQNISSSFAQDIGSILVSSAGSVLSSITAVILVIVITFLFLIQGPELLDMIWASNLGKSKQAHTARRIMSRMSHVISHFVNGQLVIALIDGSLTAVAVLILSFIFPEIPIGLTLPLGLLSALMSLIPMFGAIMGGIISTSMIAFSNFGAAMIFVVYFIVYQQVESNIIAPLVQSKSSKLPALIVIASVTIGVFMFGLLGAIIAIPIAGCVKVLLEELVLNNPSSRATKKSAELDQSADAIANK